MHGRLIPLWPMRPHDITHPTNLCILALYSHENLAMYKHTCLATCHMRWKQPAAATCQTPRDLLGTPQDSKITTRQETPPQDTQRKKYGCRYVYLACCKIQQQCKLLVYTSLWSSCMWWSSCKQYNACWCLEIENLSLQDQMSRRCTACNNGHHPHYLSGEQITS
jgi:hypothetical protein